MKDIKITEPVTVTLKAAEWYWLMGLLNFTAKQGESETLDKVYAQILDAVE